MIILGIDPGTTRIGFGVIEANNNSLRCLDYGILSVADKNSSNIYTNIVNQVSELIKKHGPDIAAIERLFFFKNQKTVISVSQMRGAIMYALESNNLPIQEFTPLQVKMAVANYGRAEKKQIQTMIRLILKLKNEVKPDDAADALAIAICCSTRP